MDAASPHIAPPSTASRPGAVAAVDPMQRRSYLFVHLSFVVCLCLQRFGVSAGPSTVLFASPPVFAALLFWLFRHGQARISKRGLLLYSGVAFLFMVSTVVSIALPDPRTSNSIGSLFCILGIYTFAVVEPTSRFDRSRTLDIFMIYIRAFAALGIVQYYAQFAGVVFFNFTDTVPFLKPVLIEHTVAFRPIMAYGSTTMRSNGFLLVEPSVFSQTLAIAVVIEVFLLRQYKYLALYAVAYSVSHSGTGVLCLAVAVFIYSLTSQKNMLRTLGVGVAVVAGLVVISQLFPEALESFSRRSSEMEKSGTSGYTRYVGQFDQIGVYIQEARSWIGYGPGATERSIYYLLGSGNPALKLFVDYGLLGLFAFYGFLGWCLTRARPLMLPILCLVMFQLGGGKLLFSPFVVQILVLCVWSDPNDPRLRSRPIQAGGRPLSRSSGELEFMNASG
jgi:hypothetical protein